MTKAYNEDNVRELKLYEENNSDLYFRSKQPIYDNLDKKRDKGTYESDKAEKLFKYHADRSAKAYQREFGTPNDQIFSVADRKQLAKELREEYEDENL